jgi:hypothetical protein
MSGVDFSMLSEHEGSFPTWVIDGEKGTGKTETYVTMPYESGLAFSFDGKVHRILNQFPERKPHWAVFNAMLLNEVAGSRGPGLEDVGLTKAGYDTHDFMMAELRRRDPDPVVRAIGLKEMNRLMSEYGFLQQATGGKPITMEAYALPSVDVVVFDGLRELSTIEEMRMRYKHKLGPFENFANRGLWKTRRLGMRDLVWASRRAAKKAVIATTYPMRIEIVKDGVLVETRTPPNWYDIWETESDLWLRCERDDITKDGSSKFFTTIKSSKFKSFPQGKRYDVTDSSFAAKVRPESFYDLGVVEGPPIAPDLAPLPPGSHVKGPDEMAASPSDAEDDVTAFMSGASGG